MKGRWHMAVADIDVALADMGVAADIGIAGPVGLVVADIGVATLAGVAVADIDVATQVGVAVPDLGGAAPVAVVVADTGVAGPAGVAVADMARHDPIVTPRGTTPMTTSSPPVLLHELPGRMRVHIPQTIALPASEALLRATAGVRAVSVNATTRNVLIHFDPAVTTSAALLVALGAAPRTTPADTLRATTVPLTLPNSAQLGQVLTAATTQGYLDRACTALKVVNLAVGLANASSPLGFALAAVEAGRFLRGVLAA
jgi:hypothetical protein